MNRKMNKFLVPALVCTAVLWAGGVLAGPVLIGHPGIPADSLPEGDVQKVFLGKTGTWSDGSRVVLSMVDRDDLSDAFFKAYVKKSPKQFTTFWKKAVFSGTGEMPSEFATEAELVAFVAATPGAVGYIDEATAHDGVKVIAIQ